MAADQDGKHRNTLISGEAGDQPVVDIPGLVEIITEFNRARTNSVIYPPRHPQVAASLDRAYQGLRELIEPGPELTLGAAQDVLLMAGKPLDARSAAFREFALALSCRNVLSITFERGFTREDLLRLHQVLSRSPEEILKTGGIRQLGAQAGVEHVRLQEVDYSHFRLTEESEISPREPEEEKGRHDRIWMEFAKQILEGGGAETRTPARRPMEHDADPAQLSAFINADPEGARAALREYERLMARGGGGVPEPRTLEKLTILLRRLRPELKSKFLAMTFDKMNEADPGAWKGFGDDLALQMLHQAEENEKTISPALVNLVKALSGIGEASSVPSASGDREGLLDKSSENPLKKFDAFFVQERQESYIDPQYQAVLDNLSLASAEGVAVGSGWQDVLASQLRDTLDEGRIAIRLCHLLVAFLDTAVEADEYRTFVDRIVAHIPDILAAGDFDLLLRILGIFRRHAAEKPEPLSRMAEKALGAFAAPDFLSRAIQAVPSRRDRRGASLSFFLALGPACFSALLDLYVQEEGPSGSRPLMRLMGEFGAVMAKEAAKRLGDSQVDTARRLVAFLKKYGGPESLPSLRDLQSGEDDRLRSDALDARLALGDAEALPDLRAALHSPIDRESQTAIRLAGQHRVVGTTAELARMIKIGGFLGGCNRRNEDLVRALGKIGDPVVLPTLKKAVRRRSLFYPGERRDLKAAIFESLDGYPRESLAGMLRLGAKSRDPRIRAACHSLQKDAAGIEISPRASRPESGGR